MVTQTKGTPPYEWVADALEAYAEKHSVNRSEACRSLLARGLRRDLADLRVLRTFRLEAIATGKEVPAFSLPAEYGDLDGKMDKALTKLRKLHLERAKQALAAVATNISDAKAIEVRGWRSTVDVEGKSLDSVAFQFAGKHGLSQEQLRDACDCTTSDMTLADVRRAIWADELEREKLAPKGWSDRHQVGYGWFYFQKREVR